MTTPRTECTLSFHGAAANSCPHSLKWVHCPTAAIYDNTDNEACVSEADEEVLIYPSSGAINLAITADTPTVTTVIQTLITQSQPHVGGEKKVLARGEAVEDAAALRSVTALDWLDCRADADCVSGKLCGIVAAFSDGTLTSWRFRSSWKEYLLIGTADGLTHADVTNVDDESLRESIADVSAVPLTPSCWLVATASSSGVLLVLSNIEENGKEGVWIRQISHHSAASVRIIHNKLNNECLIFVGSASPRHNKIWVYTLPISLTTNAADKESTKRASLWTIIPNKLNVHEPEYHGCLLGHQDWITCFSWIDNINNNIDANSEKKEALLASSGHDAKIRLWKFTSSNSGNLSARITEVADDDSNHSSDGDEAHIDDLEEGEARLVIHHTNNSRLYNTTIVSLEALLLGHEEAVTSLTWKKDDIAQKSSLKPCLLSSSMDRSILLWMEQEYEQHNITSGIWVPISRVGSAGGILGGSIGASLMGFVDATFSPMGRIVGHGYGGSLHFWSRVVEDEGLDPAADDHDYENRDKNENASLVSARWLADPCITGHFRPVKDLSWDPNGEYLLTTGSDQTTRLWAEIPTTGGLTFSKRWVEVGRPQVHGYDMTSIVCIGGNGTEDSEPHHRFVSGADEKVLRVFDAPVSTLRLLSSLRVLCDTFNQDEASWRVERAFLPSLGLSNKATADPEQDSAKYAGPTNDDEFVSLLNMTESKPHELKLPSERDLGVTTLWPETSKLFGHDSELVCLDAHRTCNESTFSTLVASSCKARNDVASAAIRLWNVKLGKCVGVLMGGHRSTVSTLSFSRDGKYLASSGKDRRICIWKRLDILSSNTDNVPSFELSAVKDSAHKRIIWSVHFCPTHPHILASGSRDGLVKVWRVSECADGSETTIEEIMSFEPTYKAGKTEPVTAVAFANSVLPLNKLGTEHAILGIGTESGRIEVWAIPVVSSGGPISPALLHSVSAKNCHFYTVNKIAWRHHRDDGSAVRDKNEAMDLTFASCSEDSGVRIFTLTIK